MSKRLLWLLASIILVPALACGGGSKDKQSSGNQATGTQPAQGSPTTSASSTQPAGGVDAELAAIAQSMQKLKSFRANITIEAAGQPKQEGLIEYVLPDRYHISLSGFEVISIGNDAYIKIGPTWTKQTGAGAGSIFDAGGIKDAFASFDATGVKKGGTDTVNGQRCQIYTLPAAGGNGEMCVANNLPVRMTWSDSTTGKVTIIFSNVNGNIEIKAPI